MAPKISTTFKETIKFAPIIKGSRDGIKIFTHISMPPLAAIIDSFGKITTPKINNRTISLGKKYLVVLDIFI